MKFFTFQTRHRLNWWCRAQLQRMRVLDGSRMTGRYEMFIDAIDYPKHRRNKRRGGASRGRRDRATTAVVAEDQERPSGRWMTAPQ
jgi:hypothetical protein